MPPQFQPYQDRQGEEIRNRWAASLDGIFQQYQATKQAEEQKQIQDMQLRGQYGGVNPLTLSPADRATGFAGPTITPAQPAIPETPNPMFARQMAQPFGGPMIGNNAPDNLQAVQNMIGEPTPGRPAVPEQTTYHPNPVIAALQRHVETQKKTAQADLESKQAGTVGKMAQARKDIADANLADRKPFDIEHSEKANQFNVKRFTQLGEALDPSKARSGAFGTSKQVYDRAERLQTLAGAYKDNNLDSRQVEELAIGLNSMLSGSNVGAASQVEKLVPKSIMGDTQKLKEWLTNDPKGTNQQEFVKRMLGSIDREKSTAADQIKRTQFERIARYSDLEKADKDEFYNVLQSAGVDPAEYEAHRKGGYKRMSAVQGAEGGGEKHAALLDKYGAP